MKIKFSIVFVLRIFFIFHHIILPIDIFASEILSKKQLTVLPDSIDGIKWYPVTIEYDNVNFRGSNLKIFWSWPGVEKSSVSREYPMYSEYDSKKAKRTLVLGF